MPESEYYKKGTFAEFPTTKLTEAMRTPAAKVYGELFGEGITLEYQNGNANDKTLGIDVIIRTKDNGPSFTVQEKFRDCSKLTEYGPEITLEYRNGDGTPGEWSHLNVDWFLLGYSNAAQDALQEWYLFNVVKLKQIIQQAGGIEMVGSYQRNYFHGKASFYAIPIDDVKKAIQRQYNSPSKRLF